MHLFAIRRIVGTPRKVQAYGRNIGSIDGYWVTRAGKRAWLDLCFYGIVVLIVDVLSSMIFLGHYHKASTIKDTKGG